jgi:hypothetical protein
MARPHPSPPDEIREMLRYDRETGAFYWVRPRRKPQLVGKRADFQGANGYCTVKVLGRIYTAQRLAWWFEYGDIPPGLEIDHEDTVRNHNWILNLRLATRAQNVVRRKTNAPFRRVSLHRQSGLFRARVAGRTKYFRTPEEAYEYGNNCAREIYGAKFAEV